MGVRASLDRFFPPPPPSKAIARYLDAGKTRLTDELFDGWVRLDDASYERLMNIHARHGGGGFYDGSLQPGARDDLPNRVTELRQIGK